MTNFTKLENNTQMKNFESRIFGSQKNLFLVLKESASKINDCIEDCRSIECQNFEYLLYQK